MKYETTLDFTAPIKASMHEIEHTLIEAIILVLIVVYVFLQSFRATIIPMLTVPVSLLGAFIAFPLLGFSVNTLTLFGFVLAIGIVVDDAIVVVEAVQHHLEHGLNLPLRSCEIGGCLYKLRKLRVRHIVLIDPESLDMHPMRWPLVGEAANVVSPHDKFIAGNPDHTCGSSRLITVRVSCDLVCRVTSRRRQD